MEVTVTNKETFDTLLKRKGVTKENVESRTKTFFISINDSAGTDEVPYLENKYNVLVLYFDDVDEDIVVKIIGTDEVVTARAFTMEQAREVIDFIERNKDKEFCLVHCAAGISRSGAVGTFVSDYFGCNYFDFKKRNPYTNPNNLVMRLLKRAWEEKQN